MNVDPNPLEYTGERMVPEAADADTFWEHIARYRFAAGFVKGLRVLDIACGEGYGSASLAAAGAASVIGVDIDAKSVEHAKRKYSVDARVGSAERIPLPDASVDIIVSFETIEHVNDVVVFVRECRRVLADGGRLLISTPNKSVYKQDSEPNPYHVSELSKDEFTTLIMKDFQLDEIFGQGPMRVPWMSPRILIAAPQRLRTVRGPNRLRRLLQGIISSRAHDRGIDPRAHPVAEILSPKPRFPPSLDPYLVRPLWKGGADEPLFLIALASVRKA